MRSGPACGLLTLSKVCNVLKWNWPCRNYWWIKLIKSWISFESMALGGLWNMHNNSAFTACMYRLIQYLQLGNKCSLQIWIKSFLDDKFQQRRVSLQNQCCRIIMYLVHTSILIVGPLDKAFTETLKHRWWLCATDCVLRQLKSHKNS